MEWSESNKADTLASKWAEWTLAGRIKVLVFLCVLFSSSHVIIYDADNLQEWETYVSRWPPVNVSRHVYVLNRFRNTLRLNTRISFCSLALAWKGLPNINWDKQRIGSHLVWKTQVLARIRQDMIHPVEAKDQVKPDEAKDLANHHLIANKHISIYTLYGIMW